MMTRTLPLLALAAALAMPQPVTAQAADDAAASSETAAIVQFTPRPSGDASRMDYGFLDQALEFMVLRMGISTREGLGRPEPTIGSRQLYGHDSRYRLEGNRVVYSFLKDDAIEPLTDYLRELESLGSEVDITSLSRNEQLAYWTNLHNVAVIEAIARNYPLKSPSRMMLDGERVVLDDLKLVTVAGIPLSPRDIRTRIVYPNWSDAKVIYGFTRGEIGGPSIQRRAYTGDNVDEVLENSAREFVNSLRGVESYGKKLQVSKIYAEAAPFYFPQMGDDLRDHLRLYAGEEVMGLIDRKPEIAVNQYEDRVADLAGGEREPIYQQIEVDGKPAGSTITPSIARLLNERLEKMEKLRRRGELRGRVIVLTPPSAEEQPAETESEAESSEGN